ncbi:YybH family protein [Plantactinospora sp. GCM10030261]|uniref:YybH family protein n=1 Tax=Plantactinospora sp. GCM10030261 TaxID=3273420 RepID=UPI00361C3F61
MSDDEKQIRALVERWTEAVHRGDLDTVLADHARDIVMYDVPPPYQGVRGIDAYRETWPPFFRWQASGGSFEIETLEITAGVDVAFANALLRCGTPADFAANPANRLRLTLGLRKENGRWVVAHEHHSFPLVDEDPAGDSGTADGPGVAGDSGAAEREVLGVHERWSAAAAAKDLDGLMSVIADDVVSYEHEAPLEYVGAETVREVCARNLDAGGAAVTFDTPDLRVLVQGDLAVSWGLNHVRVVPAGGEPVDNWSRGTRVFQRRDGRWWLIHQHVSVPLDRSTGAARTDLRPR